MRTTTIFAQTHTSERTMSPTGLLYFILSSLICQDTSFTLPSPQFPCCHLLTTGIKVSKQYWYWVWQPIKVLPNTQYYPILENIGQYQIPQCQYRSNPINTTSWKIITQIFTKLTSLYILEQRWTRQNLGSKVTVQSQWNKIC